MIHNHPNGSAFSGADLKAFSSIKNINRLYATGTKGTYQITKGQRFNEKTFLSKINKAKGKVDTLDNYNKSVRRLLNNKNFQKEAGFTFKYTND
ncbi:MAG: hypothetical protein SPL05_06770 [Eubacteriales bacterium]|nr:hypothetical protein [Eubacteriales bacterium]